ncbi:hypothetical protein SAMN05660328_10588 [Streptococcus gallolyticus]|uniref:Uncharacterized protein n=2 Tax=Streptococcus gallolyticus TaxID=315405 RepID=A0A139R4G2_9STRE|nr:hypothetical protein SGADD03_00688 [Streptococcus gallolyticus]SFC70508.1 hypothetical protein SAMN02983012_2060 [Streptococcus gallolyticus]SFU73500.1 hypothetical protein SAMN05660328_10588 [Streptococcus gallolyticus]
MNILLIISTVLLSLSRMLLARSSQSGVLVSNPENWVKSNIRTLKICDELLAISSFLFSCCIIDFIFRNWQDNYFRVSVIVVSLIYCIFAWIGIVLIVGNMVYPINGIKALKESELSTAILQVYARLHLSDLALGILTISLASFSQNLYIMVAGCVIGIMQMMFTYFGKPLNYQAHVLTIIVWGIWMFLFQLTT